ncbi:unnamed protein product, partial [Laminaria digitata]
AVATVDNEPPTREALLVLLQQAGGNVAEVSRATGKHRQQIYRWLKKYDIDASSFRPEEGPPEQ